MIQSIRRAHGTNPQHGETADGVLPTRRRRIEIPAVYLDRVTSITTLLEELPLRIWGDDPRQPERVVIECLGIVELTSDSV